MRLPLVTLILFFIQISQAQTYTYQSLINTDASWHSRCQSGGINMTATWYNNVYFKGQTRTVNGKTYQELNSRQLIREDGLKYWYLSDTVNYREHLLFDFGANVGDTLYTYNYNYVDSGGVYAITQIDTILVHNTLRRRFTVESNFWNPSNLITFHWIEGVGDDFYGILSQFADIGFCRFCGMKLNQNLSYPSNWYCQTDMTAIEELEDMGEYRIYPNPTSGIIYFEQLAAETMASVYSLQGKLLHQAVVSSNTLDIADLAAGMYLIVLETPSGSLYRNKIVKY